MRFSFSALAILAFSVAAGQAIAAGDVIGLPESVTSNPKSESPPSVEPGNTNLTALPPLPTAQETREVAKKSAYQMLLDDITPLSEEQVIDLRRRLDRIQKAKSTDPNVPPKAVVSSIIVKGEPGESPPVIRLSRNFVTTIVFTDVTGAPWPVINFGSGGEQIFDVKQPDPKTAGNVLTISPLASYAYGNLQVILAGRPSPIMVTLASDQREVDYQTNVSVQARGPNAEAPIIGGSRNAFDTNPQMTSFLDGVAPAGVTTLESSDARVQAWRLADKTYIRTRMTLFSPAWTDHQASADGMHAYEISSVSAIVLGDGSGQPVHITLGESESWQAMK